MKKLYFLLIVLTLFYLMATDLHAFQSEPKDFRGIQWDTNISKLKHNMIFFNTVDNVKVYTKKNDSMKIRNADIEKIHYFFSDGKFSDVVITFKGKDNFIILKQVLFDTYGDGNTEDWPWDNYFWNGEKVKIKISIIKDRGTLMYIYKPLQKKNDGL
jgi:hypothetical protein